MEFVTSTYLALAAIAVLVALGVRRGAWAFFALLPLGAAAAFNLPALGGATIGVADLGAVVILLLVALSQNAGPSLFGTLRPFQPGFFLTGVILISIFSAFFAPRFFAGHTEVFSIARNTEGSGLIVRTPLGFSTGNITQLFRLMLGYFVFVGFATVFRRTPDTRAAITAMIVATLVNFVLGWVDVLTFSIGNPDMLEFIRTANYSMHITDTMGGFKRMIGGFPEASSFGFFSLGLLGFWLQYWIGSPGNRTAPLMLGLSAIMVLRSTSSSAYLALAVFLTGFLLISVLRNLGPEAGRRSVAFVAGGVIAFWLAAVLAVVSYTFVAPVTEFLDTVLFKKLATDSGVERMSWNAQALINFRDTWGLGAGIGSVRASNWLIACLGSIGVLGTLFYVGFVTTVIAAPAGPPGDERAALAGGLKAGALAMLAAAVLTFSTPDLGIFFFAVSGIATGFSRAVETESLV